MCPRVCCTFALDYKNYAIMSVPLDLYPLSSCRRGALFERNPVCALCYEICIDIGSDSGGINFNLLKALKAADSLCAYLVENSSELPELEHCYQWFETHLQNESAVMCACAAVSVSIAHMEGAPTTLQQLGRQLRGLIYGGCDCIYENLSTAANRRTVSIDADAYGALPPASTQQPPQQPPVVQTPQQPQHMQATQNIQYNGPFYQGCTFLNTTNNNNPNNFYGVQPPASSDQDVRPETNPRLKRLFLTPEGDEDYTRTSEERNRFLNYLSEHHLSQRQLDCSRDNPILKAIVCFYAKWKHLKYIRPQAGPAPVLRFLTDTCALERAADDRAISAILGKMLKSGYDSAVFYGVCDYFN